jgi:DNA replication ATP-dependent helicase Dna2
VDLFVEFAEMNPDQKAAIQKVRKFRTRFSLMVCRALLTAFLSLSTSFQVMAAQDCSVIQGLPGTGKSEVITFVARLLAAHGKRVLISAYTHSAVDNVMMKLITKGLSSSDSGSPPALVRVGRTSSCHPSVRPLLVSSVALELEQSRESTESSVPSAENLKRVMKSARIVGVTALSIPRSPLLIGEHFDVVIVDEAGQISQPAVIGALTAADSFVLVGDHMQLPPLVSSELAAEGG